MRRKRGTIRTKTGSAGSADDATEPESIRNHSCARLKSMPKTDSKPSKDDPRYEPTKAELEEDMRIDATPEELAAAMFGRHPRRVLH